MGIKLSENMKNVARISSGTVIGQIISVISLPIITRIYGAEIMGVWAIIYAIAVIINTLSDVGLIQSIMVEDESSVQRTYSVVSALIVIIDLAAIAVVYFYCAVILDYDSSLILVTVFFTFIYSISLQFVQLSYTWLNRNKEYSVLMKNPIINQGSIMFFSIVLGLAGCKQYGYYIGVTAGQILTLLHMKRHLPAKTPWPTVLDIKEVIIKNKEFVKYQMPTNLTLQFRNQLPNLLIGGLFGNTMLGYFSVSQKLLNIPVTFIGQALGKVFYQRCSEMQREGQKLGEFIYRNLSRAMMLAFVPMALLAAYGDAAVVIFFGREYAVSGIIVRIIVFRAFFTFVSSATQGMDIVLKKQQYAMFAGIVQTLAIALAVLLSYYFSNDIIVCSIMITIAFICVQITYFCVMFKVMSIPMSYYLKNITLSLLAVLFTSFVLRRGFIFVANITGWDFLEILKGFMV
jgi:O-antigen/teichoic acid export membrane protein